MGMGYTVEEWIEFQNRWIMEQDQETFDKYCNKIITNTQENNYE